jgi:hypothetical protein
MIKFIKKVVSAFKEKEEEIKVETKTTKPEPKPKVVKNSRINPKKPITDKMRTAMAIKIRITQLNNILEYRHNEEERIIIAEIEMLEWVLNKK